MPNVDDVLQRVFPAPEVEQLLDDDPTPQAEVESETPMNWTIDDMVRLSRFDRNFIRNAIRSGELPAKKVGRQWLIPAVPGAKWVTAVMAGEG